MKQSLLVERCDGLCLGKSFVEEEKNIIITPKKCGKDLEAKEYSGRIKSFTPGLKNLASIVKRRQRFRMTRNQIKETLFIFLKTLAALKRCLKLSH